MAKSAKLGQNFLRDENVARRIVELVPAGSGPLLEIGAGPGILSARLAGRFPGRPLTLVEVDGDLAGGLRQRFGEGPRVLNQDILQVDLAGLYGGAPVTLVGNLPYHISKPLIDWLIGQRRRIGEAVLMLQRDFIDKLLAAPGGKKYHAQSVAFQLLFRARRCFDVPASAFAPRPKVVSTVIAARPLAPEVAGGERFYAFARLCFAERRKTLRNNLAGLHDGAALAAAFASAGVAERARAEELAPETLAALWRALETGP